MDFSQLVRTRYSVRAYKDTPVPEDILAQILEAGRLAPSAHNSQPQMVYVVKTAQARQAIVDNCPCTFGAPTILVVAYDRARERMSKMNPGFGFGEIDTSIVCTQMMLQATDLGIGSCWIGMFNREQLQQALKLPENMVIIGLLLLGYAAEDATPLPLHTQYRDKAETIGEL